MSRDDWYRNTEWNPEIEEAFFAKLRRARDKSQYLRIQACTLAEREPKVALVLLEEYFKLGSYFDDAQAHVDRATAYLALGEQECAIASYKAALLREAEYPKLQTQAYLEYPLLVAVQRLSAQYQEALSVLKMSYDRLMFPLDHFRWNGALALILIETGEGEAAKRHAVAALQAAAQDHSGFRYHPRVGLVTGKQANLRAALESIAA